MLYYVLWRRCQQVQCHEVLAGVRAYLEKGWVRGWESQQETGLARVKGSRLEKGWATGWVMQRREMGLATGTASRQETDLHRAVGNGQLMLCRHQDASTAVANV